MNKTFADRLATAMKLKGIKTASALSRDTGIERSYMYRLASGKIDNPHKYVERLAVATGVSSHWLSTGLGDPYDPEPEKPKEPSANATMLTHVTVVPPEGDWYEVTASVPDVFVSQQHKPRDKKLYEYYYVPETIECFTGFTLLVVERELRPGPGMFLARREVNGKQQLCSFLISYKGLDQTSTRQPDMQTIGRVRIMDYWELDTKR
ncbi:helix-turn-helix domain-containing protein [Endozoicomonas acroporae]|uniref:helix-turn-helix domain-containing protein n=1 Tax=Endozoicomonas acroporae TaxID=1701104 RepID=UPI0013D5CC80|nr:helix-turn-helix domain-containing protein [Endozoicomonas acroporae]